MEEMVVKAVARAALKSLQKIKACATQRKRNNFFSHFQLKSN
jgi:hypothetical protein